MSKVTKSSKATNLISLDDTVIRNNKSLLLNNLDNTFYYAIKSGNLTNNLTLTLPIANPTLNNQALVSSTTGTANWTNVALAGGNSLGAALTLGTNDAQSLILETNNTPAITVDSSGNTTIAAGKTLALAGSASGTVTLNVPDDAGNNFLTLPSETDTLVTRNGSETLANKIIENSSIINGFMQNPTIEGSEFTANNTFNSNITPNITIGTSHSISNRFTFNETNPPANEAGTVVSYGSGSNTRNMLFTLSKTNVRTGFFGQNGVDLVVGQESTGGIVFRNNISYSSTNILDSGSLLATLNNNGLALEPAINGRLLLRGGTSGTVTLQPASAAGTWSLTLPTVTGTSGQALTTDGTGITSWSTVALNGGNTLGAALTLGTNDGNSLIFRTNSTTAATLTTSNLILGSTFGLAFTNATAGTVRLNIGTGFSSNFQLVVPNRNDTLVTRDATETLTNKTISGAILTDATTLNHTVTRNIIIGNSTITGSANRLVINETAPPTAETGTVISCGSGLSTRNMLIAVTKTGVNAGFIAEDGTDLIIAQTTGGIKFRNTLNYSATNILSTGSLLATIDSTGLTLEQPVGGKLFMKGSSSGTVTIQPAAAAGTWSLTLPTVAGTSGQALITNGSGVTSWSTVALNGGNTLGGALTLGTNDANSLILETNNAPAITINSSGNATLAAGRTLALSGSTSGTVTLNVPAIAGTNTLTLPAITDTLVSRTATETLTNKTLGTTNFTSAASPNINIGSSGGIANRLSFNEATPPPNDTGTLVSFSSGNSTRNMLITITKTAVNTGCIGQNSNEFIIGHSPGSVCRFKEIVNYTSTDILSTGTNIATLSSAGLALEPGMSGRLLLRGSSSGTVTVQPAAAAGTWSLTLPTVAGTSGQALTTDGTGITSWSNVALNGGNTLGGALTLGTNDANSLILETNNAPAITVNSSGNTTLAAGKTLALSGSTSGTVTLNVPAVAGTNTLTLPSTLPAVANTPLVGNASGVLSFSNALNTFGATIINNSGTIQTIPAASSAVVIFSSTFKDDFSMVNLPGNLININTNAGIYLINFRLSIYASSSTANIRVRIESVLGGYDIEMKENNIDNNIANNSYSFTAIANRASGNIIRVLVLNDSPTVSVNIINSSSNPAQQTYLSAFRLS